MKHIRICIIALIGVAFAVLSSCAVQVESTLSADNSARIQLQAKIHPVMQAYLSDLAGATSNNKAGSEPEIISADKIKDRLGKEKGITVQKIEASLKNGVNIILQVADLQQLVAARGADVKNVITLRKNGDKTTLTLRLDRKAVEAFLSLGTAQDNNEAKMLLPQDSTLTAKKYQEQLNWALEEYGTKAQLADMFKTSLIQAKIKLPRALVSSKGFTVLDAASGQIVANIPLLELLTIKDALIYEAVF